MGQNALKIKWRVQPDATCTTAVQLKMFSAENSYLKFEFCSSAGRCKSGYAVHETHILPSLAPGPTTLSFQTCTMKPKVRGETECGPQSTLAGKTTIHRTTKGPLGQLLDEQIRLEALMLDKAMKIKETSRQAHALSKACDGQAGHKYLSREDRQKLAKVAQLDLETILAELSIAGDFGTLSELAKGEKSRQDRQKIEMDKKIAETNHYKNLTLNFLNGVLAAGALLGTAQVIYSTADWHRFVRRQHLLLDSDEGLHVLSTQGRGPFFTINDGPYRGYKFLEDPLTKSLYLYSQPPGSAAEVFHTKNDLKVREIKLDPKTTLTNSGLILSDGQLYLPKRGTSKEGDYGFGNKLEIAKVAHRPLKFSKNSSDKLETRLARRDYFRSLAKHRHKHDPLKRSAYSSKTLSRSLQAFSVLGSLAGFIVTTAFFAEGFHLSTKNHGQNCKKLSHALANFHKHFVEANAIYTQLLEVKLEISIVI